MRHTLLYIATFVATFHSLGAQAQYTIHAETEGLKDGMVYLEYRGQKQDSAVVAGGKLEIASPRHIEGVEYVHLTNNIDWGMAFWMGNDNVEITVKGKDCTIKGSKAQDDYDTYVSFMTPIWNEGRAISAQMTNDVAKYDSLQQIIDNKYKPREDSVFLEFARQHPASYITLNHIYNWRVMSKYPYERYKKGVDLLTPGAFEGEQWRVFQHLMACDLSMAPGHPFPALTLADVYGKPIDVQAFKGKYLLLTISSYGLSDYDTDLNLRRELYDKYHAQGLEMVDYQLCSDTIALMKAPANLGLRWHFVSDFKSWDNPWLKEHEIDHITQNFLIDPQGNIMARQLFAEDLRREIEKIF